MAQSPEYPDLKWVVPKSWTNANRTTVQLIVIHDTEGSSNANSAEDGAAYDTRRTDGTSTHYFVDNNSIVQCVRTADQAHAARTQGNKRGIQYELCARASFKTAEWLDPDYGLPMLQRAAAQVARDCRKWNIPARKISPNQVAAGTKGICGHADITHAFPQDNGTHTDPGDNFPWSAFINMVEGILNPTPEVEDMATAAEVWGAQFGPSTARETAGDRLGHVDATVDTLATEQTLTELAEAVRLQGAMIDRIAAKLEVPIPTPDAG